MKITVDTSEAKAELESTEVEAEETRQKVKEVNEEARRESELTFIKTVQTVQRMSSIVNQSISIFGGELSQVTKATISFITQGISTLAPILTAQSMSGWMTAQAILGLIALGQAGVRLVQLYQEEENISNTFNNINMDVGRQSW